jgi:Beta-lactamase enzyme family/ORF 12 gene product N-terminal
MITRRIPLLTAAAAAVMTVAATCSTTPARPPAAAASDTATPSVAATASLPDTPVGNQARWLFAAAVHAPLSAAATAHFDKNFLAKAPLSELNAVLTGLKSLRLDSITTSTPGALIMTVTANGKTRLQVSMSVDSSGLISGLLFQPAGTSTTPPPVPTSWSGVDSMVRSVAPQVRMLVARVSGSTCQPVQAIGASTPAPLGSAFKLYVLDALARAVASGKVSWNQQLTITSQLKSLPSGTLQNEPDGTRVNVQQAAADMISESDNTAANLLMALLGRPAVEAAAAGSGMADPALDMPFLSTRELFALKLIDWPQLADRYLAQTTAGRQALLAGTIDRVPYSELTAANAAAWTAPRDIDSLEWFASPADVCRVYASLGGLVRSQPDLAPVASVLQINNGDMNLDSSQWRSVWFKGGSEPGVLTLNYLATTRSGQTYVVSVLAENPKAALSQTTATLTLISAIKGAFELAAS